MAENIFEYLSGPVSWYTLEKRDNGIVKQLHLFGDEHFSKSKNCQAIQPNRNCSTISNRLPIECQDLDVFIEKSLIHCAENNIDVDLFLELGYSIDEREREFNTKEGYMAEMSNYFLPFFRKNKPVYSTRLPDQSRMEYHYSDVRFDQKDIVLDPFSAIFIYLRDFNSNAEEPMIIQNLSNFLIEQISTSLSIFYKENTNTLTQKIKNFITAANNEIKTRTPFQFRYSQIILELIDLVENVGKNQKKLKHNTIKFINKELIEIEKIPSLSAVNDRLKIFISRKSSDLIAETRENIRMNPSPANLFFQTSELYLGFGILMMDFYAILKMILILEKNKTRDQMIINYAGHKHTRNYFDFFKEYMNVKVSRSTKLPIGNNRCIHDKRLNQVFPYIANPSQNYLNQSIHDYFINEMQRKTNKIRNLFTKLKEENMDVDVINELDAVVGQKRKKERSPSVSPTERKFEKKQKK
jgi:hypothetical protein